MGAENSFSTKKPILRTCPGRGNLKTRRKTPVAVIDSITTYLRKFLL